MSFDLLSGIVALTFFAIWGLVADILLRERRTRGAPRDELRSI
jgi:hypothetical protein